jgi:hypothetical protein
LESTTEPQAPSYFRLFVFNALFVRVLVQAPAFQLACIPQMIAIWCKRRKARTPQQKALAEKVALLGEKETVNV